MALDRPVHAPETADGTTAGAVAALVAVLCQGRVAITARAFCAAPAVPQHRWRVI